MKHIQKIMAGLLAGLGLGLTSQGHSDAGVATNNPYEQIASRNIFGLTAPTEPASPPATADNLPRITINGMMSIFGRYQVLFKASAAGQGVSARDHCYVLSEQQSEDEIQVVHINADTGVVTFDNHGTIQEIVLAGWAGTNSLPKAAVEKVPPRVEANLPAVYPASFIRARTPDYLGGGASAGLTGDQLPPASTPEERMLLIEAQRAYLKAHNDPAADLLPPTALTPSDTP